LQGKSWVTASRDHHPMHDRRRQPVSEPEETILGVRIVVDQHELKAGTFEVPLEEALLEAPDSRLGGIESSHSQGDLRTPGYRVSDFMDGQQLAFRALHGYGNERIDQFPRTARVGNLAERMPHSWVQEVIRSSPLAARDSRSETRGEENLAVITADTGSSALDSIQRSAEVETHTGPSFMPQGQRQRKLQRSFDRVGGGPSSDKSLQRRNIRRHQGSLLRRRLSQVSRSSHDQEVAKAVCQLCSPTPRGQLPQKHRGGHPRHNLSLL
jgi:hypothetical protein